MAANLHKQFTYVRYDALLTAAGLGIHGVSGVNAGKVAKLDSTKHIDDLIAIGQAVARDINLARVGIDVTATLYKSCVRDAGVQQLGCGCDGGVTLWKIGSLRG